MSKLTIPTGVTGNKDLIKIGEIYLDETVGKLYIKQSDGTEIDFSQSGVSIHNDLSNRDLESNHLKYLFMQEIDNQTTGQYALQETSGTVAEDVGSSASNGTIETGVLINQAGLTDIITKSMQAISTAGIDCNVAKLSGTVFSVGFWVKPTTISVANLILSQFSGTNDGRTTFGINSSNKVEYLLQHTSGNETIVSNETIVINTVYFIAIVRNGTDLNIYINSKLDNNVTATRNDSIQAVNARIGQLDATNYFRGLISNVYFDNNVVWDQEFINFIYSWGAGTFSQVTKYNKIDYSLNLYLASLICPFITGGFEEVMASPSGAPGIGESHFKIMIGSPNRLFYYISAAWHYILFNT